MIVTVSVSESVSESESASVRVSVRASVRVSERVRERERRPHVQKLRHTAPVMKSERLDDHHHAATKSALRSKTAPIPCTCHKKSTLDHQNNGGCLRYLPTSRPCRIFFKYSYILPVISKKYSVN